MNIIQQIGSFEKAQEVLKQAQSHVLAPTVYVPHLGLFGCIYDDYDALFVYVENECFAYMPASEAMVDNQIIWIADLKVALVMGVAA